MNKLFRLFLLSCLISVITISCSTVSKPAISSEVISLYRVPLVCGEFDEIGCGSRAKPILLELEQNTAVKEAWLNREGTVLAVVWRSTDETEEVVKPVLESNRLPLKQLNRRRMNKSLTSFRKDRLWYHGAEVDRLSTEEARFIARKLTTGAHKNGLLSAEELDKIWPEIEGYFSTELSKPITPEQYTQDIMDKFKTDVVAILVKHIGQKRTDRLIEFSGI